MRVPKKPSGRRAMPFYWWRRFRTHKCLPYKASLINKIRNGDFDYSPFFEQAKWELHWMKEEEEEFIKNYQGKDPKEDSRFRDISLRVDEDVIINLLKMGLKTKLKNLLK